MSLTRFLLLLLLLGPLFSDAESAIAQPAPYEGLDTYIEASLDAWDVPGLALAIVDDEGIVYARGYGEREIGTGEPVDEHTVFLVASTTKAFTAASLGLLVEDEALSWEDSVIEHLPGFRLAEPYVTEALTVRDLLTHRSGLPRGDRLWYASPFDREEILRRVRHLGPTSGFRAGYGYQNIMYITAGELVEAVSDRSWDAFVSDRLFEPLGMSRSSTSIHDLPQQNVASPHSRIDGEVRTIEWRDFDNLGGAGSINSTAHDMARWLQMHLNRGTFEGRDVLAEETVEEMQTPNTVIRPSSLSESLYPETHFRAYGLGWFLQDFRGHKMVEHSGSLDGMRVRVGMLPEEGVGVVLLTNMTERYLPAALLYDVFDRYLEADEYDWSDRFLTVRDSLNAESEARRDSLLAERVEGTEPSLDAAAYAASYQSDLYGEAVVEERSEGLHLSIGPHFTGPLEHWHFDTFRVEWEDPYLGDAFVTFVLDEGGRVERLRVRGWANFERDD